MKIEEAITHLKTSRCPPDIRAPFYCLSVFSAFMQGKNNDKYKNYRLEIRCSVTRSTQLGFTPREPLGRYLLFTNESSLTPMRRLVTDIRRACTARLPQRRGALG